MITGEIKNKVDKIWTDIWVGGITNPLTVIEQLTYLMFIRSLDQRENARSEPGVSGDCRTVECDYDRAFPMSQMKVYKQKPVPRYGAVVLSFVFHKAFYAES